mgnify:CR=1 FL=1
MSQSKAQLLDPQGDFTLPGLLIGVGATFSGDVSIGGTLTKQDVTNVDSVGIVTIRSGGYLDVRTGSSINTNATGGSASGTLHKNTTSGQFAVVSGGSGGNNYLSLFTSAAAAPTEKFRISHGGQVNIGLSNLTQTTYKAQIETGTNKFISFTNAAHDDLGNEGSAIIFSRQSDGSKELSGIFQHSDTSFGIASRANVTFHAGGASTYGASPERLRITDSGLVGVGTDNPTFSDISSVSSSSKKHGIELFKDGTDTASAIKLKADNGSGTSSWSQLGYSGANATSHWANYNTAGTKTGEIVIGSTGSVEVVSGNLTVNNGTNLQVFLNAGDGSIELTRASGGAFIDFKNSTGEDHDARLQEASGGLTCSTGALSDNKGDVRSIPKLTKNSQHALVASDAGQCLWSTSGGLVVNNSVMSAGDAVTFVNSSGSDMTITQGSGVTIYNSNNASTGNRTLAGKGIATLWFSGADTAYISGSGLS